jgi:hypothetical protein
MTLLEIQSQVTKTAAFTGTPVDVSAAQDSAGNPLDWTLKLNVSALSDSVTATVPCVRFQFDDMLADHTATLAGPTVSFKGTLAASYDKVKSFKKQDFPDLRIGATNNHLRLCVTDIESGGSVTYRAWLEY